MKTIVIAICAIFGSPPISYRLDHGVTITQTSTAIEFRSAEDAVKFMLDRMPMDCRHYNIRIVNNGDTLYVKDTDYKGNITFYTKKREIKRIQVLICHYGIVFLCSQHVYRNPGEPKDTREVRPYKCRYVKSIGFFYFRADMGQPKAIESPERLWELFQEFRTYVIMNPFKEHDFVGKDATEVNRKKQRPTSWVGFEGWLASNQIAHHLGHYEQNTDDHYTNYLPIIRAIKAICSADIIEGAMAGIYNHNLAARLEGIADKKEVDKTVHKVKFTDAG